MFVRKTHVVRNLDDSRMATQVSIGCLEHADRFAKFARVQILANQFVNEFLASTTTMQMNRNRVIHIDVASRLLKPQEQLFRVWTTGRFLWNVRIHVVYSSCT